MMQESEYPTSEKATAQPKRNRWLVYAVLSSLVIAGIIGMTWSLTSDSRSKQATSNGSSLEQPPGLRGSHNDDAATVPFSNNGEGVVDPVADASNAGDSPAAFDAGTNNDQTSDNAPGSNPDGVVDFTKTSWPELVGRPGEEARSIIMQENPNMTLVQLVRVGSMVTADWREDRVRIYVEDDEERTVVSIPNMG
jgi:Potato inhibitor I family